MHEMGIALEVIDIARSSIPADVNSARIEKIYLKIGRLAAVVPRSLRFCFEIAAKDTVMAGAELVIEETPVVARCRDCRQEWTLDGPVFACEACQSGAVEIISGRELDIESIEIVQEDTPDAA